ncbi:hypothetical protein P7F60_26245 [Rhizobium sp. YJ-22]|uniref:hypothetical protein n=1 Tax=Rhizobium sp. YJ-22 TaxID=3037556 RepID=UPI002412D4B7|nr:hypothetical protein [Rhizobium sp. YJ-22]MDG3579898.1 hypothetical protein [Rhizobium sp. YJ-22]
MDHSLKSVASATVDILIALKTFGRTIVTPDEQSYLIAREFLSPDHPTASHIAWGLVPATLESAKVHPIDHERRYFRVPDEHVSAPPSQRRVNPELRSRRRQAPRGCCGRTPRGRLIGTNSLGDGHPGSAFRALRSGPSVLDQDYRTTSVGASA